MADQVSRRWARADVASLLPARCVGRAIRLWSLLSPSVLMQGSYKTGRPARVAPQLGLAPAPERWK